MLLLIDDWAWYGSSIPMDDEMSNSMMPLARMPHLEKFAKQGMTFRSACAAAPQCAPSRVSIQTGQSTARSGYTLARLLVLGRNMPEGDYDTRKQYQKLPVVPNVSDTSIDADALYDLQKDPQELRNLIIRLVSPERDRARAKEMKKRLVDWLEKHEPHKVDGVAQRKLH